ncbi:MAG TPA: hypothetical protein PK388_00360, partial [Kiritimatiellia bacterium]|nr:hypothetical protein [Kiritimatiellia bacterium]
WHYPPHMQAGASLAGIVWGAREVVHWWCGDHLAATLRAGWRSFATLPIAVQIGLATVDVAAVFLIGRGLRRLAAAEDRKDAEQPFGVAQAALFALAWSAAAGAISLASYAAPRLNVLPAIGVALLAALILDRMPFRYWAPSLCLPAILAMASNQGTAESYRRAGQWNQAIYAQLRQTADEWRGKKILLFDVATLRRTLPPPLAGVPDAWANDGNAPLARGFTFIGMAQLAAGRKDPGAQVVHGIECGARIAGDRLIWHDRFDPSRPHADSMVDVFVVDAAGAE